nr:collagen alpha-2(I) chain-like [Caretta caretta]
MGAGAGVAGEVVGTGVGGNVLPGGGGVGGGVTARFKAQQVRAPQKLGRLRARMVAAEPIGWRVQSRVCGEPGPGPPPQLGFAAAESQTQSQGGADPSPASPAACAARVSLRETMGPAAGPAGSEEPQQQCHGEDNGRLEPGGEPGNGVSLPGNRLKRDTEAAPHGARLSVAAASAQQPPVCGQQGLDHPQGLSGHRSPAHSCCLAHTAGAVQDPPGLGVSDPL